MLWEENDNVSEVGGHLAEVMLSKLVSYRT